MVLVSFSVNPSEEKTDSPTVSPKAKQSGIDFSASKVLNQG